MAMNLSSCKCLPGKENLKYALSIVGWVCFYFFYLAAGGLCIKGIEKDSDVNLKKEHHKLFLDALSKHNFSINNTAVKEIVLTAIRAAGVGALNTSDFSEVQDTWWTLSTGVFLCSTIVTTIGYGNIVPATNNGRAFTIVYACIGIPITGIVLAKIGAALTKIIKKCDGFLIGYIQEFIGKVVKKEKVRVYVRIMQLVVALLILIICFWIIPSLCMMKTEGWDFFTAFYFSFISITTIGLGDIVPGGFENKVESISMLSLNKATRMTIQVTTMLYLIMALAAISIVINLVGSIINAVTVSTINTAENMVANKAKRIKSMFKSQRGNTSIDSVATETWHIDEPEDLSEVDGGQEKGNRIRKKSVYDRIMEIEIGDNGQSEQTFTLDEPTQGTLHLAPAFGNMEKEEHAVYENQAEGEEGVEKHEQKLETEPNNELLTNDEELENAERLEDLKVDSGACPTSLDNEDSAKLEGEENRKPKTVLVTAENDMPPFIPLQPLRETRLTPLGDKNALTSFEKPPDEPHFLLSAQNFKAENATIYPHKNKDDSVPATEK